VFMARHRLQSAISMGYTEIYQGII